MHTPQPRFFFNEPRGPSTGDKLLKSVNRLKIDLWRFDRDDDSDEPRIACDVELHGSFPLDGTDGAGNFAVVSALLRHFRALGRDDRDGEEGGVS